MEDTTTVYINQLDAQLPHQFLHHYATPGVTPPSARVDPKLKIRPRRPLRIWDIWKYGLVVVSKGEHYSLLSLPGFHLLVQRRKLLETCSHIMCGALGASPGASK